MQFFFFRILCPSGLSPIPQHFVEFSVTFQAFLVSLGVFSVTLWAIFWQFQSLTQSWSQHGAGPGTSASFGPGVLPVPISFSVPVPGWCQSRCWSWCHSWSQHQFWCQLRSWSQSECLCSASLYSGVSSALVVVSVPVPEAQRCHSRCQSQIRCRSQSWCWCPFWCWSWSPSRSQRF